MKTFCLIRIELHLKGVSCDFLCGTKAAGRPLVFVDGIENANAIVAKKNKRRTA